MKTGGKKSTLYSEKCDIYNYTIPFGFNHKIKETNFNPFFNL